MPSRFSLEPGCATWEKHLWTVELCWLTVMSRHVWEEAKPSGEQKKKKELWCHWWSSRQHCSLNRRFNYAGLKKKLQQGIPSVTLYTCWVENWDTPLRQTLFTLSPPPLPPSSHTHSYTPLSAWWSLINSAEALMHQWRHSRQHRAH